MKRNFFWIMICLLILCSVLIGYGLKKCDCGVDFDDTNNTDVQIKIEELNDKLLEYLDDIYNNDTWMNGNVKPGVYVVTLSDLKDNGYDISMFVNPITKKECDLNMTFGRFILIGETEDGMIDYTYDTSVNCD